MHKYRKPPLVQTQAFWLIWGSCPDTSLEWISFSLPLLHRPSVTKPVVLSAVKGWNSIPYLLFWQQSHNAESFLAWLSARRDSTFSEVRAAWRNSRQKAMSRAGSPPLLHVGLKKLSFILPLVLLKSCALFIFSEVLHWINSYLPLKWLLAWDLRVCTQSGQAQVGN